MSKCKDRIMGLSFGQFSYSYAEILKSILEGKAITEKDLNTPFEMFGEGYRKKELRILRNAIFARHGRAFKSADLSDFFYGPDAAVRFKGMPMSTTPDKSYTDKRLTQTDKQNLKQIRKQEKR